MDSFSGTAKASEVAARGWFRTWGAAHPLGALFVGLALGGGITSFIWWIFG